MTDKFSSIISYLTHKVYAKDNTPSKERPATIRVKLQAQLPILAFKKFSPKFPFGCCTILFSSFLPNQNLPTAEVFRDCKSLHIYKSQLIQLGSSVKSANIKKKQTCCKTSLLVVSHKINKIRAIFKKVTLRHLV